MITTSRQGQWVLQVGQAVCWLPETPTISSTGQIVIHGDASFVVAFHGVLSAWLAGRAIPLSGEIIAHNYSLKEMVRYAFKSASISSLAFPTLDWGLQTPGRLTVSLQATSVTPSPGSGKIAQPIHKTLKHWRCCDFGLHVGGVETQKVSHVDGVTVTSPGTFPDIGLLIPAFAAKGFVDLCDTGATVPAKINCLSSDHLASLFTLAFTAKVSSITYAGGGGGGGGTSAMPGLPVSMTVTHPALSPG